MQPRHDLYRGHTPVPAARAKSLIRMLGRVAAVVGLACIVAPPTLAASPPATTVHRSNPDTTERPWVFSLGGGVSVFLNSQSSAIDHFYDPVARLRGMLRLDPRLALGIELSGVVTGNENYRLLGGYVRGEGKIYRGDVYSLDLVFGVGLGNGPAILSPDLVPSSDIVPWGELGLHMAWRVADSVGIQLDLLGEHLGVVTLTAGLELYL